MRSVVFVRFQGGNWTLTLDLARPTGSCPQLLICAIEPFPQLGVASRRIQIYKRTGQGCRKREEVNMLKGLCIQTKAEKIILIINPLDLLFLAVGSSKVLRGITNTHVLQEERM